MTLIAGFGSHDIPFLLGDVLLSSKDPRAMPLRRTPTHGTFKVTFDSSEPGSYVPVALVQKLFPITDQVLLAWAGSPVHARTFVREFRERFGDRVPSPEEFDQEMSFDADMGANLSVIGLCRISDDLTNMFSVAADIERYPVFGVTRAAGTGARRFLDIAKRLLPDNFSHIDKDGNDVIKSLGKSHSRNLAINEIMTSVSGLYLEDVFSTRSLDHLYGGGFQIGSVVKDRVVLYNNFRAICLGVEFKDDEKLLSTLPVLLDHQYLDDNLIIKRTAFGDADPVFTYVIPPLIPSVDTPSLYQRIIHEIYVTVVFIMVRFQNKSTFYMIQTENPDELGIIVRRENNSTSINMGEFLQNLLPQNLKRLAPLYR